MPETPPRGPESKVRLGMFLGVFTPSILTILGVVLFLRTGWVVGNVGLVPALGLVVLAHVITFSTALSVAAVATNMTVGAGGAYFMISRSLGLEIGGAIGIPLFLAQTFSVTLYAFGLAESLRLFWPEVPEKSVAAITIVLVAAVAGRGADLALKLQIPVMVAISLALISLFAGAGARASDTLQLWSGVSDGVGFWQVFAVFFPAVTGLMAGVSLSGELKEPKRSIPLGTLLAVSTGFVVYLAAPIALAVASDPQTLVSDNLVWFKISAVPILILPGLLGAILSSAMGSILGAPRTLEALIEDRVLPRPPEKIFGRDLGKSVPHLFSTAVALAAVGFGGLNAVAPVLTMFFLTTYGVVNLVAGLEQLSGAPSYRPTIRVPWIVSLGGAAGCLWVMWLINRYAAVVAVIVEILIYVALRRRSLNAAWGDMRYGTLMSLARTTLLKLRRLPVDPRNWRPNILVFAGETHKRIELIRFGAWLNQNRGILTVSHLLIGDLEELAPRLEEATCEADRILDEAELVAFAETEVVEDFENGLLTVCQANGIAGMTSNTLMLGWSTKPERMASMLRIVRQASVLGLSTLVCRITPRRWASRLERIDVWWGGLESNGDMMLLFAHLLSLNPEWATARVTVKSVESSALGLAETEKNLRVLLDRSRIDARTKVIAKSDGQSIQSIIQEESRDADVVFLGLQVAKRGHEPAYAERLARLIGTLPTVILVRAAGSFAGHLLDTGTEAAEPPPSEPSQR